MLAKPDPKDPPRIRSAAMLAILHREWRECVLCGEHRSVLSLHHISKHPRDDVIENLVMLCGDGVRGCHGRIEAGDRVARRLLGEYIRDERLDTIIYLTERRGSEEAAWAWLERTYLVEAA